LEGDEAQSMIYPVILCGGSGTRLWPLSRKAQPKQFAHIFGNVSLFQRAIALVAGPSYAPATIVTGDVVRFEVLDQLEACGASARSILIEPEARNTAAAVLAATLSIAQQDENALILVLPSDHLITDAEAFEKAALDAVTAAATGQIITFGIQPTRPETGYGYLELENPQSLQKTTPQPLVRFVEKPTLNFARDMVESGRHLWNAGIFMFSATTMVAAFRKYAPECLDGVTQSVQQARADLGFQRLAVEPWAPLPNVSIDYAIMEKADNLAVMSYSKGWTDLGDWKSVWENSAKDGDGNACSGSSLALGCSNSLLRSEAETIQLVGIGLEDMIVVATRDAVVVAPKSQSQRVGEAVNILKAEQATQAEKSPREQRPWGWFESLALGNGFQVKRIHIKPGHAISLQSHNYRAEHWVVVAGSAKVTINEDIRFICENESIYVPQGAIHRLENPGSDPVEIIEVQTGSYFGEDDIERYADNYART
jgi:mannose-1-phosphate guanylyltransferase/mannose-6-phosphate isomerase